jgi:hypothetical protein
LFPTNQTFQVIRQTFAAFAGPADLPGGVADNQSVIGNVFVDQRAGVEITTP